MAPIGGIVAADGGFYLHAHARGALPTMSQPIAHPCRPKGWARCLGPLRSFTLGRRL